MAWEWIARLAQSLSALGPPGLFAITFLDGTAIPILGGAEALTLLLAWKQPAQLPWIVLAGALGATLGALVFYRVGRAGGQLVLARMKPARREWLKGHVARHAFWTLLVGVLLPPPFPTKPLVLTAGVVGTPAATFILAIFTGRVLRFSALACIGIQFGGDASTVLTQHYPAVLGALTGLAIVALLGRTLSKQLSRRTADGSTAPANRLPGLEATGSSSRAGAPCSGPRRHSRCRRRRPCLRAPASGERSDRSFGLS